MEKSQAEDYLTSLLNKTLRVTTTDTRMFLGQFKCTDSDRNIILSQTFEYRLPPPPKPTSNSTPSTSPSPSPSPSPSNKTTSNSNPNPNPNSKTTLDLTSRYMGLVVVPGDYISQIEVEESESQVRRRSSGLKISMGEELAG